VRAFIAQIKPERRRKDQAELSATKIFQPQKGAKDTKEKTAGEIGAPVCDRLWTGDGK
jgi:hypothetical protein